MYWNQHCRIVYERKNFLSVQGISAEKNVILHMKETVIQWNEILNALKIFIQVCGKEYWKKKNKLENET